MNEKLVTSLSISQQMKEAGIEQSSEKYWIQGEAEYDPTGELEVKDSDKWFLGYGLPFPTQFEAVNNLTWKLLGEPPSNENIGEKEKKQLDYLFKSKYVSAFTSGELGEMLPSRYSIKKIGIKWGIFDGDTCQEIYTDTMADALGLMLLHLKKEGLIGKEGGMKEIPFVAFGGEELDDLPKAGDYANCPRCKKRHKIKYGTCNGVESKTIGFVNCGKKTYMVTLDGKLLK